MGLDQYLYGKKNNIGIEVEIGYWRKSNHIHKWFVDNIQDGIDNCASYTVSKEQLIELKEVCQQVLDNKELAEELLPTQNGFFFGSTEYGEYYFEELKDTIEIIDKALSLDYDYFVYHSSW